MKHLLSFLIASVGILLSAFWGSLPISAQGDCGNGLIQRLEVGGRGWIDPTPPAQGVRMRQQPGQTEVARMEPGEEFTVLDGPQCFDTYSWFEVETTSGKRGWIAEGVEAGEYFVDPLASSGGTNDLASTNRVSALANTNETCEQESKIELGQFVELTTDINKIEIFYGHPLLKDGFFSQHDFKNLGMAISGDIYEILPSDLYLTVAGPYCFNGEYMWQIAPTTADISTELVRPFEHDWETGSDFLTPFFWVPESEDGTSLISPSNQEVPSSEGYQAQTLTLSKNDTAPLISPEQQIAFNAGAGGGGGYSPFYWNEASCNEPGVPAGYSLGTNLAVISTYTNYCMYLYPFEAGQELNITIYTPTGDIYSQYSSNTQPLQLFAEVKPGTFDDTSSQIIEIIPTNGARVELPDELGTAEGVWIVEASSSSTTIRRAFGYDEFEQSDFQTGEIQAAVEHFCNGAESIFTLTGFEANQELDIVLVEGDTDIFNGTSTFQEINRWATTTGNNGELIIDFDLFIPEGMLIITEPGGDWNSGFDVSNGEVGGLGELSQQGCQAFPLSAVERFPMNIGDSTFIWLSTPEYLSFNATEGDIVTIQAVSANEEDRIDPYITLLSPDGREIAMNDNAENPQYSTSDSEIRDILLLENGLYTLRLASHDDRFGTAWVQIISGSPEILSSDEDAYLSIGTMRSASLNSDTGMEWQLEVTEGDKFQIEAQSSEFDIMITVFNEDGDALLEDDDSGERTNALIQDFEVPADGTYTIVVRSWGDKPGNYTIRVINSDAQ